MTVIEHLKDKFQKINQGRNQDKRCQQTKHQPYYTHLVILVHHTYGRNSPCAVFVHQGLLLQIAVQRSQGNVFGQQTLYSQGVVRYQLVGEVTVYLLFRQSAFFYHIYYLELANAVVAEDAWFQRAYNAAYGISVPNTF